MAELVFRATLPDDLHAELLRASRECECSPAVFVAEAIEATLASRILPRIKPGMHGARVIGTRSITVDIPVESEYADTPLDEIPLLSDLSTIEDIV